MKTIIPFLIFVIALQIAVMSCMYDLGLRKAWLHKPSYFVEKGAQLTYDEDANTFTVSIANPNAPYTIVYDVPEDVEVFWTNH